MLSSTAQLTYINCSDAQNGHRMAYWQWGDAQAAHVVVCVHGLTRQGRDFDILVSDLLTHATKPIRIVCPDVVGRGQSDWLKDPSDYRVPLYANDMMTLLAHLHAQSPIGELNWVGTSLGGLIGLAIAGQPKVPAYCQIHRLVLNDVGPTLEWKALQRMSAYVGKHLEFESLQEAADVLWSVSCGFGPHTPEQWLALTRPMIKPLKTGKWVLHYDPAIAQALHTLTPATLAQNEELLWQLYDQIKAPTLLLRGKQSDLLSPETAHAMTQRGPKAHLTEFSGVGHAPTLVAIDQRTLVRMFLLGTLSGKK